MKQNFEPREDAQNYASDMESDEGGEYYGNGEDGFHVCSVCNKLAMHGNLLDENFDTDIRVPLSCKDTCPCVGCNIKYADEPIPAFPLLAGPQKQGHREKEASGDGFGASFWKRVAKGIPRSKWTQIDDAAKAVKAGWEKRRKIDTRLEKQVKERWQVKKWANENGITVHFGRLHDLCVEKHSELDEKGTCLQRTCGIRGARRTTAGRPAGFVQ